MSAEPGDGADARGERLVDRNERPWIVVVDPRREQPTPSLKASFSAGRRSETYHILMCGRPVRNRKLTRAGAKKRPMKEAIMLDVAFVALGLGVLALMGVYALALRRL